MADINLRVSSRGVCYIPSSELATSPALFSAVREAKAVQRHADVVHQLTGSPAIQIRRAAAGETSSERAQRQQNNLLALLGQVVSPATAYASLTGWRHFTTFCLANGIDVFLKKRPTTYAVQSPYPFAVTVLGTFLTYLCVERDVSGLSACTYLWAVRYAHQCNFLDTSAFDHDMLTLTRAACKRNYMATETKVSTRRLAFTLEMFEAGVKHLWNPAVLLHLAVMVACLVSITYLLRKSECLFGFHEDHHLRSQDVSFEVSDPFSGVVTWITSDQAAQYEHCVLLSVKVVIRSAKNDQCGHGYPYHNKVTQLDANNKFCIASAMWLWATRAHPLWDMPFFSSSRVGASFILQYPYFKGELKKAAVLCGFPPERIGTHSLRIYGASVLHAAGKDSLYIMHWGRWKSLCFLDYIQWSLAEMEMARSTTANPTVFLNNDLQRLHL